MMVNFDFRCVYELKLYMLNKIDSIYNLKIPQIILLINRNKARQNN